MHLANINSLPEFDVTIDGKKVHGSPLTVQIALGQHTRTQVEKSGYTSVRYDITFDKAGHNLYHDLHLNAS